MENKLPKLILTDIDGVWTDGGMYYDATNVELKKFNTYDSAGVLFAHSQGIPVGILTGEDTNIVKRRALKLNIEYCFLGCKDKVNQTQKICESLGISFEDIAYIGDDINDLELLKKVGFSACPLDAEDIIKKNVMYISEKKGGSGVVRDVYNKYFNNVEGGKNEQ